MSFFFEQLIPKLNHKLFEVKTDKYNIFRLKNMHLNRANYKYYQEIDQTFRLRYNPYFQNFQMMFYNYYNLLKYEK